MCFIPDATSPPLRHPPDTAPHTLRPPFATALRLSYLPCLSHIIAHRLSYHARLPPCAHPLASSYLPSTSSLTWFFALSGFEWPPVVSIIMRFVYQYVNIFVFFRSANTVPSSEPRAQSTSVFPGTQFHVSFIIPHAFVYNVRNF